MASTLASYPLGSTLQEHAASADRLLGLRPSGRRALRTVATYAHRTQVVAPKPLTKARPTAQLVMVDTHLLRDHLLLLAEDSRALRAPLPGTTHPTRSNSPTLSLGSLQKANAQHSNARPASPTHRQSVQLDGLHVNRLSASCSMPALPSATQAGLRPFTALASSTTVLPLPRTPAPSRPPSASSVSKRDERYAAFITEPSLGAPRARPASVPSSPWRALVDVPREKAPEVFFCAAKLNDIWTARNASAPQPRPAPKQRSANHGAPAARNEVNEAPERNLQQEWLLRKRTGLDKERVAGSSVPLTLRSRDAWLASPSPSP